MRAMKIQIAWGLALASLLAGCKKPPPAGRPKDVCAGVKAETDCAAAPEGPLPKGFSKAANCYDVGNQQFHCGLFEAASASFEKSALMHPSARTQHALGEAYYLQERWAAAQTAFSKAVALDPKKRESWVRLADVEVRLGHPAAAHADVRKALGLDPDQADAMQVDANAFVAEGKYGPAIDALRRAEAHGNPAQVLAATAQEVQACTLQVRMQQRHKAGLDALAQAQGQLADALGRQLALLSKAPAGDQLRVTRPLADARLASGDMRGAEEALEATAKLDPKDFVSLRMVALIREHRGDAPGARAAVKASLAVQPKQAMPFIVLGRLDLAAGDTAAAKADFDRALANETGKDATETRQLAGLAMKVGALDKAEALLEALDADPGIASQVDFWLERARASAALHHGDKVKAACARAHALVETATCPPAPAK